MQHQLTPWQLFIVSAPISTLLVRAVTVKEADVVQSRISRTVEERTGQSQCGSILKCQRDALAEAIGIVSKNKTKQNKPFLSLCHYRCFYPMYCLQLF